MDAVEYLKNFKKICESYSNCYHCPFNKINNCTE